jgi:hypothetical protein
MVAERGGHAGGARRWWGHRHLTGRWFSAGSDGAVEVRILVF